jgi:hypothetical protein
MFKNQLLDQRSDNKNVSALAAQQREQRSFYVFLIFALTSTAAVVTMSHRSR